MIPESSTDGQPMVQTEMATSSFQCKLHGEFSFTNTAIQHFTNSFTVSGHSGSTVLNVFESSVALL